jgi:POTRA domain, FtsQ-type
MGVQRRVRQVAPIQQGASRRVAGRSPTGVNTARSKAGSQATYRAPPNRVGPVATKRVGPALRRLFRLWLLGKVIAAAILVAGFGIASEVAGARQLKVAEVVIVGNELVAAEDIAATINVGGTNTFAVRGRRLERILGADPAIESASVRARLPDTVEVVVHERAPAVVWETNDRSLLADDSGLALRDGARDDLPVIHAPDGPAPDPGGRVDPGAVRMARTLLPRLDAEGLGGGQLEYRPATGASLIMPDAARLAIGTADDLEDKLAAYRAIRAFLDQNRTHAQFIDVRFLGRPYFR